MGWASRWKMPLRIGEVGGEEGREEGCWGARDKEAEGCKGTD